MNTPVSRTAASAKNAAAGLLYRLAVSVLKYATRMVFVRRLPVALYGVSGLFGNVLGLLTLADLGIGTAVTYALYRPLAEGNNARVAAVMAFLKKAYRIIALTILGLGLLLLPFLPYLVKGEGADALRGTLWIYYLVFLGNMVIDYFFSYRRTLAIASQEARRLAPFQTLFETAIAAGQIAVLLLLYRSAWCYLLFLLIQSVGLLAENLVINRSLDRRYPVLKQAAPPLPEEEKKSIFKNIRALMLHKVGSVVVAGTDNLIISALIAITVEAHYSNYAGLIITVTGLVNLVTSNATASFGNLIVSESPEKQHQVFREWLLGCFAVYGVGTAFFLTMFQPFIELSYTSEYLLDYPVVILVVVANFYLLGVCASLDVVKSAAGIYDQDKWVPILQSVLNLGVSIALAIKIGLAGVFWGTLISTLAPLIIKPFLMYRYLFGKKPWRFFALFLGESALTAGSAALSVFLSSLWRPEAPLLRLLFAFGVTLLTAPTLFILVHLPFAPFRSLTRRAFGLVKRKKD